jgi:23S rRNA (uracil1939-C5)-methyltransferase
LEVTIEKLVYGGDGLARVEGDDGRRKTVFVPLVLPGERADLTIVNERPGFARARLERVIAPAAERTTPSCPYFGECGGCHYQHTTYEAQLTYKASILRETVERIAKIELPEIQVHPSPPLNYRNRTRLKIAPAPGGESRFSIGYYRLGSHTLLPVKECPISSPLINQAIQAIWSLAAICELPKGLEEIEFFADDRDASLLIEFLARKGFDEKQLRDFATQLQVRLPQLVGIVALPHSRAGSDDSIAAPEIEAHVAAQPLKLVGVSSLPYKVGEFTYLVSAGAFFQANRFLAGRLIELAIAHASGRMALDLYAGVGLFTLPLAQRFERVTAVEASPASFRDLGTNAGANVRSVESTTEGFLPKYRGARPDMVVADPPRSGLGKRVVAGLGKLLPKRIAYVSCDPATLARDLPGLASAGYQVTAAHLVDLFPQTFHLESVVQLER